LSGGRAALVGAIRYLFVSLLGSLAYLLGVALLYHAFGSVDMATLAGRMTPVPAAWVALGLMGAGLLLKTALFPLHFWLPPAHTSAPSPVSAVLSALVIKASFYILLRLWIMLFGPFAGDGVAAFLGFLGAAAILWGSIQALRQKRLKLLVAYSTVAQIGYLFLAFPLASWNATMVLLLSHALAKSAMFLAAGNFLNFGGHDRIADLDRIVQRLPLSAFAFALAGVSLMGLPPSGGFIGKWLLLEAALAQGRWDLVAVMLLGGLLAAAYVFKVLGKSFTQADITHTHQPKAIPVRMEWVALILACGAILLGFAGTPLLSLLEIGAPFDGSGP
jgi:formate hydrogenlyase subunit 3/multisubunit Na+/H+ antiporter MnhD subunit